MIHLMVSVLCRMLVRAVCAVRQHGAAGSLEIRIVGIGASQRRRVSLQSRSRESRRDQAAKFSETRRDQRLRTREPDARGAGLSAAEG